MRHVLFMMIGIAALATGCAGAQTEEEGGSSEDAISKKVCAVPAIPNDMNELKKLDSCQLKALFESDVAKENTADDKALAKGAYEGIPLVRKEILPLNMPPGLDYATPIMLLMKISNTFDNAFASKIWHGKEFTVRDGQTKGSVLNFIDMHADGINAETRKAAEAVHFVDKKNKWMVLDYTGASTGLEGLFIGPMSAKYIQHVYDTARVVNREKQIYLGMAWTVKTPGKLELGTENTVATAYFALQPHK